MMAQFDWAVRSDHGRRCRALVTLIAALVFVAAPSVQPLFAQQLVIAANENMIQLTREQLVQNVFRNQQSLAGARANAEDALDVQMEFVSLIGTLSDDQRAKLELAGRGDIERFFGDFERYLDTVTVGQITMQQWNDVWQELQPLQIRYTNGLHGSDSLFQKTIPIALDDEQRIAYRKLEAERQRRHYQALVKATVSIIDGKIPLTRKQREKMIDLMMHKTRPPTAYGQSYYQYQVVLFQMSQIEDDLRPIFEDNEWELMQKFLNQGRGMEHMLRRQGIELDLVGGAAEEE